jgi:hypothetical protein
MHLEGERFLGIPPEITFPGSSLAPQAERIRRLIEITGAANVLDYGSGKGRQYSARGVELASGTRVESVQDYWDVDYVHCYDPCYPPFSKRPEGKFDGVVCTDVLEHCPEEDIGWILDEIFGYARHFVFANVACMPAKKRLPNGENAHVTVRPVPWWRDIIDGVAARHPRVVWEVWIASRRGDPVTGPIVEDRLGSEELTA